MTHKTDFVYEGHFTNDATWDIPKRFKNEGYQIHMIFLGLKNQNLSQLRVTDRVSEGGHYVNKSTIDANFTGNLEKLDKYFSLMDELIIIDSSEIDHKLLLSLQYHKITYAVNKEELPLWFIQYLPQITSLLK
ncbi:zeta toxin family protein [Pedobacter glucosidilyticus]|uniref:zeta toxin family protein n=1 Tax=Pedobacter glucosidilyticus TaxID=1122941 RepID=UPI0009DBBCA8